MLSAILNAWALLFGMGMMLMAGGLQGTLLSYRGAVEGFSPEAIGVVMSAYFIGFITGSMVTPRIVRLVGHIRVFAALASLCSVATVMHALVVDPVPWFAMRLVTGICYAGLYVVAESWINDRSTNDTRGGMLAVYSIISYGAIAIGALLMNAADPTEFQLFVVTSVLISLGLIPILLTTGPAPSFDTTSKISYRELYDASPLGVTGCFGSGMAQGAFFSMLAVYGQAAGFSVAQISLFASVSTMGGMVLQWPIGRLSDRFDRRLVLVLVALLAAAAAIGTDMMAGHSKIAFLVLAGLYGGLMMPIYALSLAHTNDHLEPRQMVAASSNLVAIFGIGAIGGPLTASLAISNLGPSGFFWLMAAMLAAVGLFGLYRMTRRPAVPLDDQGPSMAMPFRGTALSVSLGVQEVRDAMDKDLAWMSKR